MDLQTKPPSLASSSHTARSFYAACNALPLYEHAKRVFQRAMKIGIVEGSHIANFKADPERAWTNSIIGEIDLYHVIHRKGLRAIQDGSVQLPFTLRDDHPLRNKDLCGEIEAFDMLTELDRQGAPTPDYAPILNNGQAPLALLARLTDYAVTHKTEDRTPDHIGPLSDIQIFRTYASEAHAQHCLKMDAKAGERLYAPVAEVFGYPTLAGDILQHAYRINHPEIHNHTMGLFDDSIQMECLDNTKSVARRLEVRLRRTLKALGFDLKVVPRLEKHMGKIMRKFYRLLGDGYDELKGADVPSLEAFILKYHQRMSLWSINDPVALKVILYSFRGHEIDKMPDDEKGIVIRAALDAVKLNLDLLGLTDGFEEFKHTFYCKDNGYMGHHLDGRPRPEYIYRILPLEVQVKTREWDEVASHGKAAHWFYLGGDSEFIEMVQNAYHKILRRNGNGLYVPL